MKFVKLFEEFKNMILEESFWGNKASGVLIIAKDTGRILIGLRSGSVNEPYTWGNFGGAIGMDDSGYEEEELEPSINAKKEMMEEIGYSGSTEMIESYVFKSGSFIYYNYLGIIPNESDIDEYDSDLNWEVDKLKWVTFEELINHDDLHFGIESLLENAESQIIDVITNL
jgi:8-oxo-dGTP pyrophosphatase MutT (NUDIX family)